MQYRYTSSLLVASAAAQTYGAPAVSSAASSVVSSAFPAGSTLPNGGYVCNPAHQYPAGQSCQANGTNLPTLVSVAVGTPASTVAATTSAPFPAGSTLPNGGYVCNPAHQYPAGQSCQANGTNLPTLVSVAVGTPASTVAATTSAPFPAGSTLPNGGYVCNPAHQYPAGQSCEVKGTNLPTLVSVKAPATTSAPFPAGSTLPNGGYVCNPAHQYPAGQSCQAVGTNLPTLVSVAVGPVSYTPAPFPAGSTLPNGGYVCNPAHQYPAGQSCEVKGTNLPTLVSVKAPVTTSAAPFPAGSTLPNGGYVCNPAHQYPAGQSCQAVGTNLPTLVSVAAGPVSYTPAPAPPAKSEAPAPAPPASNKPAPAPAPPASSACVPVTKTVTVAAGPAYTPSGSPVPAAPAPGKECPVTLAGKTYEFPHLIVTADDKKTTSPTQYNATISSKTTSYLNFDIPAAYKGKTCDVVFALPTKAQLETSNFELGGAGALDFFSLSESVKEKSDISKINSKAIGSWGPMAGYAYAVSSGACAAGERVGYAIGAEGNRTLTYFQDYNPCPIGLYIIAH